MAASRLDPSGIDLDADYKEGMRLPTNYLARKGYRLPAEAEIEYAIRAEAVTSRNYGETEKLLPCYARYQKNGEEHSWPVGGLKPNDFGLFDAQGNVYTWCQDRNLAYPTNKIVNEDREDAALVISTGIRVLRGGSFSVQASNVRSASRYYSAPGNRLTNNGFRPARTFTP